MKLLLNRLDYSNIKFTYDMQNENLVEYSFLSTSIFNNILHFDQILNVAYESVNTLAFSGMLLHLLAVLFAFSL